MFPMKFFEYLAAGVPVVGVQLQALQDFSHVAKLVDTPDAFLEAIEQTLLKQVPPLEQRLLIAQEHTYTKRTQRMLAQIATVLQGRSHGYDPDSAISNEIAPEVSPS